MAIRAPDGANNELEIPLFDFSSLTLISEMILNENYFILLNSIFIVFSLQKISKIKSVHLIVRPGGYYCHLFIFFFKYPNCFPPCVLTVWRGGITILVFFRQSTIGTCILFVFSHFGF